jgi:hypothetical protein
MSDSFSRMFVAMLLGSVSVTRTIRAARPGMGWRLCDGLKSKGDQELNQFQKTFCPPARISLSASVKKLVEFATS